MLSAPTSGCVEQAADPNAIVVAGDSAGGGLALSLLLALKRDGLPLPAASVILCPWLDLTLRTASASDAPLATDDDVRRCVEAYLSGHPRTIRSSTRCARISAACHRC